jgi:O-antigen/teichoic acid export membrane protein
MARNAAANYVAYGVQLVVGVLVTPFLLRGLGVEAFGTLSVILSCVAYVAIAEAGIGIATVRRIAAASANDDEDLSREILGTSFVLWLFAALLGVVVLVAMIGVLSHVVPSHGDQLASARWALALIGAATLVQFVLSVYPALLFGFGRSDLLIFVTASSAVVGGVLRAAVAVLTHDLVAVAGATAASVVLAALAVRHVARRNVDSTEFRRSHFKRSMAVNLLVSGWRNALIGIASTLAVYSDVLIVSALKSVRVAAAYGVASRVTTMMRSLATAGGRALIPSFAHHGALAEDERLYVLLRESTAACWLLAVPATLAVVAFGDGLLRLWLGNVPANTLDVLRVLALSVALSAPGASTFALLSGIDRLQFLVRMSVLSAGINVALSVILVETVGAVGPAIGTLVTVAIFEFIVFPVYACRFVLHIRFMRFLGDCAWLLVPTAAGAAFAVVTARVASSPAWQLGAACLTVTIFLASAALAAGPVRRSRYRRLLERT